MIELKVDRAWKRDTYTIGRLYVNGTFFCNTVEDRDRGLASEMSEAEIAKKKVYGETAIPTGKYRVCLSYSPKFKRVLPEVLDVKGFSGIRIHSGNTANDSLGCIIVGENRIKGGVVNSRNTLQQLLAVLKGGDDIRLTII